MQNIMCNPLVVVLVIGLQSEWVPQKERQQAVNEPLGRLSMYEKIWNDFVPLKRNCNGRNGKGPIRKEIKGMIRQKHMLWYRIRSEKDKIKYRSQFKTHKVN